MAAPGVSAIGLIRRFAVVVHDVASRPSCRSSRGSPIPCPPHRAAAGGCGGSLLAWAANRGAGGRLRTVGDESVRGGLAARLHPLRRDPAGLVARGSRVVRTNWIGLSERGGPASARVGTGAVAAGPLGSPPRDSCLPAWQVARATAAELGGCGFRYLATFGDIRAASGSTIPLATWSWDWGVLGPLGRVGQRFGDIYSRLRPAALPCVVVHPADVDRGYLPPLRACAGR